MTKKSLRSCRICSRGLLGPKGLEEMIVVKLPERNTSRIQRRKQISVREFRLNSHIDEYDISDVMFYLDSDVNILPISAL